MTGDGIGVVGFCMGGMLAFIIAAMRPDKIKAAVPFYGFPQGDAEPDWSQLTAKVRGHMAENDDFFGPEAAGALEAKLQGVGQGRHHHGASRHRPRVHGSAQRARHARRGGRRADLARGTSRSCTRSWADRHSMSVAMGAVLHEPADHHTRDSGDHQHDPHRCLGVSEHVAEPDVVSIVEAHDDNRGDRGAAATMSRRSRPTSRT